jgi:hypothetical protein
MAAPALKEGNSPFGRFGQLPKFSRVWHCSMSCTPQRTTGFPSWQMMVQ